MNLLSARSIGLTLIVGFVMLVAVGALVATLIDLEATLRGVDPLYQGIVVVTIAVAPVVVALALVYRRRVARLDAAAGLVLWGLLIVVIEHVQWGRFGFGGHRFLGHTEFHFQMLAAYGLAALALVGVVVAPLIRRGDAADTTPHGVPPRFWIAGLFLWGYPVSWAAALALSFRTIFRPEGPPAAPVHR